MKKISFFIILMLLIAAVNVFSRALDQKKIVIIAEKSNFKDEVVKYLSSFYRQKNIMLPQIDLKNISTISEKDWNVIVILSPIQQDKISESVINFSKKVRLSKKIILANTADSGQWNKKQLDYDTITTASKKENIELFSKMISEKIDNLIK